VTSPQKNRYSAFGIQLKLLLPAVGFCLFFGLLILSWTWFYLDKLGQQQSDSWGQHLALQLAGQARQPMLYNDDISLQVLVNNLVDTNAQLSYASIYDVDGNLQVQSSNDQHQKNTSSSIYTHQILVEQSIAGYVQVTIDSRVAKDTLLLLFWSALIIWVLLSTLLCLGLGIIGRNLSRRLTNIAAGLPTHLEPENEDEIDRLEASIKPLLVMPQIGRQDNQDSSSLTLSICCENIQRLQAQLTEQNYHSLLSNFDVVSNSAAKLFDAVRLSGSQHCVHLRFSCDGDQDNALIRAVSCFSAISELVKESTPESGAGLILCAAVRKTETQTMPSQVLQDQQREITLQELVHTTALADPWQLLIQAVLVTDLRETEMKAKQNTAVKSAVKSAVNYDELPNAVDQVLFTSLRSDYQTILAGQLTYIRSQLPDLANSSLSEVAS
jgi:uncharacterized membrane protein affecting hemolysin expression